MFFAGGDRNCDHVRGGHIIKLRFGAAIVVFMFIVIVSGAGIAMHLHRFRFGF